MLTINLNLPTLPTQDQKDAMDGANTPDSTNVFITANDLTIPTLQEVTDSGNTTTNDIQFDSGAGILLDNNSRLREGTIDAGFGGTKGIAQICAVGYELKWEAGRLYVMDGNGLLIRHSLYNFTTVPSANDDDTKGYYVGSLYTLDSGVSYICTDSTSTAATWSLYDANPQVNSDWNAVSGVEEILNKPTIPDASLLVPYTGANADVNLGEFGIQLGNLEFDNTPTNVPTGAGSLYWNDTDGTLDLKLKGGNVTLQVGQEQVTRVVNKTATNISLLEANYQAVRITGAQGQRLKVDLALATTDVLSAETIGLVTETIANNQEGFVTTSGLIRGINTTGSLQSETWADGDILYLSGVTAGNITNVKPTAPTHLIVIGYVVHSHITQGTIYVKVDNGYEIGELHNVLLTSSADKDILAYESSTSLWKNKSASTLGIVETNNSALTDARDLKYAAYDNTDKTITGTTAETYLAGLLVPTLTANSSLDFLAIPNKTGTAGTIVWNLYYNTTNNMAGTPVKIGTYTHTAVQLYGGQFIRRIVYKNSLTSAMIYRATVASANDFTGNATAMSSLAIDLSAKYLVITASLTNAADTAILSAIQLMHTKP